MWTRSWGATSSGPILVVVGSPMFRDQRQLSCRPTPKLTRFYLGLGGGLANAYPLD